MKTIEEARDVAPKTTKVEEEAVATEEIAAMPATPKKGFSNSLKQHMNVLYCFSCGYNVDHDGYNCPPPYQKQIHLPNVKTDDAHMYEGARMRAQYKTLPDGTGAGQRWITKKQTEKGIFVLDKKAVWKTQQQTGTAW